MNHPFEHAEFDLEIQMSSIEEEESKEVSLEVSINKIGKKKPS